MYKIVEWDSKSSSNYYWDYYKNNSMGNLWITGDMVKPFNSPIAKAKDVDYTEDVNLAGYKKEDISIKSKAISREYANVVIRAEKGEEGAKKVKQHTIWVDTFKYDIKAIEAKYEAGMLSIKIPLKVHKFTKVEIQ